MKTMQRHIIKGVATTARKAVINSSIAAEDPTRAVNILGIQAIFFLCVATFANLFTPAVLRLVYI